MLEIDLIYLTFRRVHTLEISFREMRTPELSTGDWRMYLSTRRQVSFKSFCINRDSDSRFFGNSNHTLLITLRASLSDYMPGLNFREWFTFLGITILITADRLLMQFFLNQISEFQQTISIRSIIMAFEYRTAIMKKALENGLIPPKPRRRHSRSSHDSRDSLSRFRVWWKDIFMSSFGNLEVKRN
jgi:hypothetical protein